MTQLDHNAAHIKGILFPLQALAIIIASLAWVYIFSNVSFNFNVIWLSECAKRILDGGTMANMCFETNPPLSILIYTPMVLLHDFVPQISLAAIFPIYIFLIICGATGSVYYLARYIPLLTRKDALFFALIFFLANTALTGRFFGERDHLSFVGAFVFFLAQYVLTSKIRINTLILLPILILSAVLILIKPHYGFIAFLMMLDRLRQWKDFRAVLQPDIIALATLCLCYAGIVFIIFPDYIFTILPDVAPMYAVESFHINYQFPFIAGIFTLLACWIFSYQKLSEEFRPFVNRLFSIVAVSLLIFFIQKKGWGYHLVPFQSALFCAAIFSVYKIVQQLNLNKAMKSVLVSTISGLSIIAAFLINPILFKAPDHKVYQEYNLATEILDTPEGEACSFMMFASMPEIQSLAYYNQCTLASRFAVIWFFSLVNDYLKASKDLERENARDALKPYADRVAEDLEKFNPHILIGNDPDMIELLFKAMGESSIRFQTSIGNYTLEKTLENESPDYYAGTVYANDKPLKQYTIYKRNDLKAP